MNTRAKPYENETKQNVQTRAVRRQRRRDGLCVNNAAHGPAYKGGRCLDCWVKKIDAERLRQPDGTLKTRAKWQGPLPEIGDFLQSPQRPRYAYRIAAIAIHGYSRLYVRDGDEEFEREITTATFTLERVELDDVPEGATIHTWRWDPRGRKRGPTR